jgi:hypothetical protein
MRSVQYQTAPDRTAQILHESAIVLKAIARHQREATLQGRTQEARGMEALRSGISTMVLGFTQPHQSSYAA